MTKLEEIEKEFDEIWNAKILNKLNNGIKFPIPDFEAIKSFYRQTITELENKIKTDLLAIADQGEYEDLRREVLDYFEITR